MRKVNGGEADLDALLGGPQHSIRDARLASCSPHFFPVAAREGVNWTYFPLPRVSLRLSQTSMTVRALREELSGKFEGAPSYRLFPPFLPPPFCVYSSFGALE